MLFNPLLDDRQFLSTDVCKVLGINLKQLEHAIDPNRSIVSLRIHNEQRLQGKRRVFCGEDVLKIGTVFATNPTGFPQKFARTLADDVARRASIKGTPLDKTPELTIISWPMANGDWARATSYNGIETKPRIPVAGIYFGVDRFIDETIAKLKAVADEQPLPDFTVPDPVADASLLSPENDFFRLWAKDDQGRDIMVGLTYEETTEFLQLQDDREKPFDQTERYLALCERREAAKFKRMADEHIERIRAK